jgi:hypothetical protein
MAFIKALAALVATFAGVAAGGYLAVYLIAMYIKHF